MTAIDEERSEPWFEVYQRHKYRIEVENCKAHLCRSYAVPTGTRTLRATLTQRFRAGLKVQPGPQPQATTSATRSSS
jgi:hypothetical protein